MLTRKQKIQLLEGMQGISKCYSILNGVPVREVLDFLEENNIDTTYLAIDQDYDYCTYMIFNDQIIRDFLYKFNRIEEAKTTAYYLFRNKNEERYNKWMTKLRKLYLSVHSEHRDYLTKIREERIAKEKI